MGTQAKPPDEWPVHDREEFESLVRESGEVAVAGLSERIQNAAVLVCHHVRKQLVGVAALKRPKDAYREKVSERSGTALEKGNYPFELGWVFVRPEARGGGVSRKLVAACLEAAGESGVFATTREDNDPMRCCLAKNGLKRLGRPYKSERGEYYLVVYARLA